MNMETYARDKHGDTEDMNLPPGKTCGGDCLHFDRCNKIFGHVSADKVCDWSPSKFLERQP